MPSKNGVGGRIRSYISSGQDMKWAKESLRIDKMAKIIFVSTNMGDDYR